MHWFCPRYGDDGGLFFDEDCLERLSKETAQEKNYRRMKLQEVELRRGDILEACKILAFDSADAAEYVDKFKRDLAIQLRRCDVCVREFHRSRALLNQLLEQDYETEQVRNFMDTFDQMNTSRIGAGLNSMTDLLIDLPPDQRNITAAGDEGMYALFEALNCGPFLCDEDALQKYFDRPFRLVQTKKKIKLPNFVPGMTAFLFSHEPMRQAWAERNFSSIKRPFTSTEFDHSVKPYLEAAARRVNVYSLEYNFLATFWKGARLIISHLPKSLITNHFLALDFNIGTLAMEHWQIDAGHFSDMVTCYTKLLELSPKDFWEMMGNINSQHVAENILRSPVLQRLLTIRNECEPLHLKERFSWVLPFIRSIKPENLVPPVRTILDHLLHKFQSDTNSKFAQHVTWNVGLKCLHEALISVQKLKGGFGVVHLLELVAKDHMKVLLQDLDEIEKKQETQLLDNELRCLEIIEMLLALDVLSLAHGREVLLGSKSLDYEIGVSGLENWRLPMRAIKAGYPLLSTAIISGIAGLLPLETFTSRQMSAARKQTEAWNNALTRTLKYVAEDLLERLESFSPEQLIDLYQERKAAQGLIALLFNGEQRVHHSTLNVFKVMSGEDSRRDTMMHLIKAFFGTTLSAVANVEQEIARAESFSPTPMFIKICTDILDCLCDSQDGLLRSQTVSDKQELIALEQFWQGIWVAIDMIFRKTESWSNLGRDKQMMQDFCRDTMDLADYAFDQYSVIAGTLHANEQDGESKTKIGAKLLRSPKDAFMNIAKWLRLRDDWLISKAVGLTAKMLLRLHEVGIEVDHDAAQYIEDVITSNSNFQKVRTKLTEAQKAELQRALEKHLGEKVGDVFEFDGKAAKRQGTLEVWASSRSGTSTPVSDARPTNRGVIDVDDWAAKNESLKDKKLLAQEHDKAYTDLLASASKGSNSFKQTFGSKKSFTTTSHRPTAAQTSSTNFLIKRRQEKEAAEKSRAEMLAKQKLGAGSGVAGLGDMGKDHSLKGQNVMVSSDEESDDEDEMDEDIFGPKQKKGIERPSVDPNGAVGLKPEVRKGPVKIQRAARSLKDMRARLAPDLQPLHRVILKWDFFHTGDYPPGANTHIFREVENVYNDPASYQDTFEPLLTLEAWQGIVKSREENSNKSYEIKVLNRTSVDNFIEISSSISQVDNKDLGLSEGDIVLLSKSEKPSEESAAPHCLARICKVKRQKSQVEVVYQLVQNNSLAPALTMQATVHGLKIQSITPLEREYGALQSLKYYDLCQQIIKAAPSRRIHFSEKQVAAWQDVWNVNRAQSEAIQAALENDGFSLIQGPPGSGKTKTIIAIVGGLLSQTLGSTSNGSAKISVPVTNGSGLSGGSASKKLLVCAPSNAAVDELVMRLKEGVKTRNGRHHQINVVRIGRSEAINSQVLDVTMEQLVNDRIGGNKDEQVSRSKNAELFKEHEKVCGVLRELYQSRDSGQHNGQALAELENDIIAVRKRKNELGVAIDKVKDGERNAGRDAELNRKRIQQAILDEAHVICATLSGSGHDIFQSVNIEFETVIIDEAAQCVEMSSLIPLKYGCVKCIMVGDPKQLPPTVFSKEAAKFQYEQSLFVRMQNNFPDVVHLLDTQYRMHPQISIFPSRTFYDGLLKDGFGMAGLRQRPWHASALLAPYRFFDVQGQHQSTPKGHSLINAAEVDVAMAIFDRLTTDFSTYDFNGKIGIITPYKSQLRLLRERFSNRFGKGILDSVEFNTTDAFQGRESEIIIFSCVRASPIGGIGFLQDIRRMNVGLTRAKASLWVLGNSESLIRGHFWKKLVEDAQARDVYTTGNVLSMLRMPSTSFPANIANTQSMCDVSSDMTQMNNESVHDKSSNIPKAQEPDFQYESQRTEDLDVMEGIRYRFQDRISKKRLASPDDGSDRRSSSYPPLGRSGASQQGEDIAMTDASDTATPQNELSTRWMNSNSARARAETPLSTDEGQDNGVNPANGSVKSRQANVTPAVPPAMRKKPAASPFIPTKKQAGKPRR